MTKAHVVLVKGPQGRAVRRVHKRPLSKRVRKRAGACRPSGPRHTTPTAGATVSFIERLRALFLPTAGCHGEGWGLVCVSDTRAFSITTDQPHRPPRPASGPTAGRGQPLTLRGYVSLAARSAHMGTWGPQQESGLGAVVQTLSQLHLGGCGLVGRRHPASILLPLPGNCLFRPFRVGSFRTGAIRPSREGGLTTCTCRGAEPKLRGSWGAPGARAPRAGV